MNILVIVLFLIAAFHFCLYYCNMDVFSVGKKVSVPVDYGALSESKELLEKHLKELKQYSSHG